MARPTGSVVGSIAVRSSYRNGGKSVFDFFAAPSAADLARAQKVGRIRKVGQIRGFTDPDPKEAEWLAREVRRWRLEGRSRATQG